MCGRTRDGTLRAMADSDFSFFHELYRRRVLRTTAAYLVIAYVISRTVIGAVGYFGWPEGIGHTAVVIFVLATIPVIIVSWLYDWTPWGIFRTPSRGELPPRKSGPIDYRVEAVLIFLLLIALGYVIGKVFEEIGTAA